MESTIRIYSYRKMFSKIFLCIKKYASGFGGISSLLWNTVPKCQFLMKVMQQGNIDYKLENKLFAILIARARNDLK